MSPPHFFAGAPEVGHVVTLGRADSRHAVRSLRLRPGDGFTSSDGRGATARCVVTRADAEALEGEVASVVLESQPLPAVRVLLAPPKGERLAWAVQKLTEVGVDAVELVETNRSVRRWPADRAKRAIDRLRSVAHEAAKQSRRAFLPAVEGPSPWNDALAGAVDRGPAVVLWEGASDPVRSVLPEGVPAHVAVAVGPEGGISDEDAAAAASIGASPVSLGALVMRTETAAVVGAALVMERYGRLG